MQLLQRQMNITLHPPLSPCYLLVHPWDFQSCDIPFGSSIFSSNILSKSNEFSRRLTILPQGYSVLECHSPTSHSLSQRDILQCVLENIHFFPKVGPYLRLFLLKCYFSLLEVIYFSLGIFSMLHVLPLPLVDSHHLPGACITLEALLFLWQIFTYSMDICNLCQSIPLGSSKLRGWTIRELKHARF